MKVAIEGTHCAGKTTLATMLADRLGWPMIPEMARAVHARGYELNESATYESQESILNMQITAELRHMGNAMICDRSTLSVAAYCRYLAEIGRMTWPECLRLSKISLAWLHTYDLIIQVDPHDCLIALDGVRSTDRRYRNRIHELIHQEVAWGDRVPGVQINGTPESRLDKALDAVAMWEGVQNEMIERELRMIP